MIKTNQKDLAKEAIILLREMFGEGIEFECIEHFKTNEGLTGIAHQWSAPAFRISGWK